MLGVAESACVGTVSGNTPSVTASARGEAVPGKGLLSEAGPCWGLVVTRSRRGLAVPIRLLLQNGRIGGTSVAEWPLRALIGAVGGHSAQEVALERPKCIRSFSAQSLGAGFRRSLSTRGQPRHRLLLHHTDDRSPSTWGWPPKRAIKGHWLPMARPVFLRRRLLGHRAILGCAHVRASRWHAARRLRVRGDYMRVPAGRQERGTVLWLLAGPSWPGWHFKRYYRPKGTRKCADSSDSPAQSITGRASLPP